MRARLSVVWSYRALRWSQKFYILLSYHVILVQSNSITNILSLSLTIYISFPNLSLLFIYRVIFA